MCHWAKYVFDSLPKADWIKINQPTKQSSSQSITDSPDLNVNVQITSVQKVSFFQSNLSTTKTTELSKDIKGNIVDLHEAGMITRKVVDQHKTSQFINDLKAKSSFGISSIHCFRGRETQCTFCHYYVLLVIHLSVCIWMFNILWVALWAWDFQAILCTDALVY